MSDDDTDTEESAESIEGEVEAKKNNGPALIGEGEDDDAETDDDGFESSNQISYYIQKEELP